jgi:dTDP-4-amino-4,6-dideoxygalactose transaminase
MTDRIFLSPPDMGGDELELIKKVFASNFIAPAGPMLVAFEQAMTEYLEIPHVVAVSSGTAAMHLALRHIGIGTGDIVLASSLTFIGSVSPAVFQGAEVVFVDSDMFTWNMNPDLLAEGIEDSRRRGKIPKAVIPTDLYGQCADLDRINEICNKYEIPVLNDSAESLGSLYKGRAAGKGAYASIYSFNGNKIITTSGGGLLASEDKKLIDHARKLATQSRDDFPYYHHTEIGYNYRMSNVLAAIGLGQLQVLDQKVEMRRKINRLYRKYLGDVAGISFMPEAIYGKTNCWLTVIQFDPERISVTPEEVRAALEIENIEARPVWKPMHLQPVFAKNSVIGGEVSEALFRNGLCLPSGSAMTSRDVERVSQIIKESLHS